MASALLFLLTGCSQMATESSGDQSPWTFFSTQQSNADKHFKIDSRKNRESITIEDQKNSRRELIRVASGDSVVGLLNNQGVNPSFFYDLPLSDQRTVADLHPGDMVEISSNKDKTLKRLARRIDGDTWLVVKPIGTSGHYSVSHQQVASDYAEQKVSGTLTSNLEKDMQMSGIPLSIRRQYQELLGHRIDMDKGVHKGARYAVVYRQNVLDGQPVGKPEISALMYDDGTTDVGIYAHAGALGGLSYYDSQGNGLKEGWLKFPLKSYKRISSPFNPHRRHPITGRLRPHLGTDLAASRGTPIYAASDGVVSMARRFGGYGNFVSIEHAGQVETRYGHMNRIQSGLRPGDIVEKGQIIGYVGSTGLSTGPHLHFEIRINGTAVDPMKADMSKVARLSASEKRQFLSDVADMRAKMMGREDYVTLYRGSTHRT